MLIKLIPLLCLVAFVAIAQGNRVLLRDISTLTLSRGQRTTGRRSAPVPQIECIGGTANGKFSPKVVQCYNRGWDGHDVQWECKAEMPMEFQFGKIEVSCEGYDYPNDPYVLAGSCGLRYELDYSASGAKKYAFAAPISSCLNFEKIVSGAVIIFIIYLVYLMLSSNGSGTTGDGAGRGGGGSWGPPPDDRRPPPPGWNPPPSYDETCGSSSSSTGRSGPGFYSGLGLGALGGYFFGRNTGYGGYGSDYRYRGRSNYYDSGYDGASSSYTYDGPSTSSTSGSTHTSTSYGGTSRR